MLKGTIIKADLGCHIFCYLQFGPGFDLDIGTVVIGTAV